MKTKHLGTLLLSFLLLLPTSDVCFAQDATLYKSELAKAAKQDNPSEYRAQAFKQYLKGVGAARMSETELNQFVAGKLEELVAIDFWSAFLVQLYPPPAFIKWHEIRALLSAERVAAFKKLTEFCATHNCPKEMPADFPKAGVGWARGAGNSGTTSATDLPVPSNAAEYGQRAAEQLNQRKYNEAIQNASECLRLDKRIFECYYLRGLAHYATAKYDVAVGDLTKYIEANPKDPNGFAFRAECYFSKENYQAAVVDLEASLALASNPETLKRRDVAKVEHHKKLAFTQLEQGKHDDSIKNATECLRLNKKNHDCYQLRASANYATRKLDDALRDLTQVIQLKPESPAGYQLRGQIYAENENYDAAIADFSKALQIKYSKDLSKRVDSLKIMRDTAKKKKPTKP